MLKKNLSPQAVLKWSWCSSQGLKCSEMYFSYLWYWSEDICPWIHIFSTLWLKWRNLVFNQPICWFSQLIIYLPHAKPHARNMHPYIKQTWNLLLWTFQSNVKKVHLTDDRSSMKGSLRQREGFHWKVDINKKKYTSTGTVSWNWWSKIPLHHFWRY